MTEFIKIEMVDGDFVRVAKVEANILLASIADKKGKDSIEFKEEHSILKGVVDLAKTMDTTSAIFQFENDIVFNRFKRLYEVGILTPLTLKDDEFRKSNNTNVYTNKRYRYIIKRDNVMYNTNAYKITVKACYNHKDNKQIPCDNTTVKGNPVIYISRGGVVTDGYISECSFINSNITDRKFNINSIVNITVSKIIDGDTIIHTVDHRDPKLKALMSFYNVPIKHNESIRGRYKIRDYEKIAK